MTPVDVVVVGAGIGGLASAMRVASSGARVLVVERQPTLGGKMRTVEVAGRAIDSGPTVFTMKYVFDELFDACGLRFEDFVAVDQLDVIARHAWSDGSSLDLFHDRDRTAAAIAGFAGQKEADNFFRFARYAAKIHERVQPTYMGAPKTSMTNMAMSGGVRGALGMLRVDWHRTMWRSLCSHLRDPRLRQLFGRYATYSGSSPFRAPATLNVITHVEQEGVWRVQGGMHALARGMGAALQAMGVEFALGEEVREIATERGQARAVMLRDGGRVDCSAVILNADPRAVAAGRFGEGVRQAVEIPKAPDSLSAITFGWVAQPQGFDLAYHTVFFSDGYEDEFEALFDRGEVPAEPTVYVCAQDRVRPLRAAKAPERLFALINAPPAGDEHDFRNQTDRWRNLTLTTMAKAGLTLESVQAEHVTTPTDFARMFPGSGGALYGPATHSAMGAFARPGARTKIRRLYQVGGSIHPGAGVPMVTISGRWAADAVLADHGPSFAGRHLHAASRPASK